MRDRLKTIRILTFLLLTVLTGCSDPDKTLTIKGTIIAEDDIELNTKAKFFTDLHDGHSYMLETDSIMYIIMTPSLTSDPLDSSFTGTFVLSDIIATGTSKDYFGGNIQTTSVEFRDLISYK